MKYLLHLFIFIVLTVLTQIGGLVYLITLLIVNRISQRKTLISIISFCVIYLLATYAIVPAIAPIFGREKIKENPSLQAHSFIYTLLNRNYVRPAMNQTLGKISKDLQHALSGVKLAYLDANFPFMKGFPLLPHLSHNDGKKVDITFIYEDQNGEITNSKPSVSGYGVFEDPIKNELNQNAICKNNGHWQYDIAKYITLGSWNKDLKFSTSATRKLMLEIIQEPQVKKIFIEPHLKKRMILNHSKIRFHGCHAVRHDDHIHFQI